MATRAQRKNLTEKQGDFLELNKKKISQKLTNSDTSSEEDILPKNTFELLSEDDPLEKEDNNEPQEDHESPESNEETPQTTEETSPKLEKKNRTKRKQKKKNKKKEPRKENINDEEFDHILEKYSHYSQVNKNTEVKRKEVALFEIQPQFLNPENEEKKIIWRPNY
jgi:flagellar motor protein MotB